MKLLKITDEILNYQFIPVPNKLLHNQEYFKISTNAKLIYILLNINNYNKNNLNKKITNFTQREYTIEDFEKLYSNNE